MSLHLKSLTIRPCQDDEIGLLNDIEERADTLFPAGHLPLGANNYPVEQLECAKRDGSLIVACSDEGIVGFAVAEQRAGGYHLFLIAVMPEWGRQGIGRCLIRRIVGDAREKDLEVITLTTFSDVPWNAQYYAKLGFDIVPSSEANTFLRQILESEKEQGYRNRVAMQLLIDQSTL
jgi:N-acetylglutamate synthase-like GNAT family acetyltransferase